MALKQKETDRHPNRWQLQVSLTQQQIGLDLNQKISQFSGRIQNKVARASTIIQKKRIRMGPSTLRLALTDQVKTKSFGVINTRLRNPLLLEGVLTNRYVVPLHPGFTPEKPLHEFRNSDESAEPGRIPPTKRPADHRIHLRRAGLLKQSFKILGRGSAKPGKSLIGFTHELFFSQNRMLTLDRTRVGGGDRNRTCISRRTLVFKTSALTILCDPSNYRRGWNKPTPRAPRIRPNSLQCQRRPNEQTGSKAVFPLFLLTAEPRSPECADSQSTLRRPKPRIFRWPKKT